MKRLLIFLLSLSLLLTGCAQRKGNAVSLQAIYDPVAMAFQNAPWGCGVEEACEALGVSVPGPVVREEKGYVIVYSPVELTDLDTSGTMELRFQAGEETVLGNKPLLFQSVQFALNFETAEERDAFGERYDRFLEECAKSNPDVFQPLADGSVHYNGLPIDENGLSCGHGYMTVDTKNDDIAFLYGGHKQVRLTFYGDKEAEAS